MEFKEVATTCNRIVEEVEQAIVGKRVLLDQIMAAILAGGHILLEDYPGLAKTLIANSFANALGLEFKRIQFTPDLKLSPTGDLKLILFGRHENAVVRKPFSSQTLS